MIWEGGILTVILLFHTNSVPSAAGSYGLIDILLPVAFAGPQVL